ncbi:p53-like transcription factor [Coniochaeta ligniaria NRRL 30616]|uniref:p53-like transcription factor n=1 Tax=Coniochaeta ligniaria NRRL 30616 TaxID=1408157 RepID=A0A1J7J5F1_9PEZI|nr:p53-like transcription factor [Coniochaeta ligniaria NRRL 30616]
MSAFNSMPALSSGAPSGPDGLGLSHNGQSLHMDFDQDLNFDESLLDGVNGGLPPLPFTPSYDFETFSTTFEDPFSSYPTRHYDAVAPDAEAYNGEESSPQELDNKLLGFSAPIIKAAIVPDESAAGAAGSQYSDNTGEVGLSAELYGMFFVAEDVFGGDNNPARPLELTCYRRNLWQCSGQITLPKYGVSAVVTEQGRRVPVFDLAASITAIESIEGKSTEIISIPWKSSTANPGGGAVSEDTKVASAPPQVPLDLGSGQELDGHMVSVPVSWKRLQFKHATANNGRRKGLQQHYVVQINLLGKTKSGEFIKIAEIQSGPVIVRGRSPRNFDSRKDVPLTGDKKLERRSTETSIGSTPGPGVGGKPERGDLAQNLQRYHSLGNIQNIYQSTDWISSQVPYPQQPPTPSQQQHPSKKLALSPSLTRPPVPSWSSDPSISSLSQQRPPSTPSMGKTMQTLPINLSLSEDERSPNNRSAGSDPLSSPQFNKTMASGGVGQAASGANPSGSPLETADMLYEYFPLSLDDWMPPVDAIYRPHVVHHTVVPPEVKAQQTRTKTKRYFTD